MNKKFDAFIAKPGMAWPVDDLSTPIDAMYTITLSQKDMDDLEEAVKTSGALYVAGLVMGMLYAGRHYISTNKKQEPKKPSIKKQVAQGKDAFDKYQDVCGDCGNRLYGAARRDMGEITISEGICPICHKKKGIVPSRDWYYSHEDKVTVENWD